MNKDIKAKTLDLEKLRAEGISIRYMTEEEEAQTAIITRNSVYKPKYRKSLKNSTKLDVHEYYNQHPEAGAKDVLSDMIKEYSSLLPPIILLEVAQVILEEWELIQASKKQLVLA